MPGQNVKNTFFFKQNEQLYKLLMLPKIVAITLFTSPLHLLKYSMKTIFIYLSNLQIEPDYSQKLVNKKIFDASVNLVLLVSLNSQVYVKYFKFPR